MTDTDGLLAGRTLLMSGGSRGIGLAIAVRAAREGANIAFIAKTDRPDPRIPGTVHTAAAEIEAAGGQVLPIVGDIRDAEAIEAAVSSTVHQFGGVDVVVNNASAISLQGFGELSLKRYDLMLDINARGTFALISASLPHLLKSTNARVITLSPPLNPDLRWLASYSPYTLSKYGMTMLTLGLAEQYRGRGVIANCLWPATLIATAAVKKTSRASLRSCSPRTPRGYRTNRRRRRRTSSHRRSVMTWNGAGVVVTGGGNGIGRAIAERLAGEGARVVVNDLDEDAATEVAQRIGGHAAPGDAASLMGVESLVRRAREHLTDVDVWFGNAGVERGRSLATSEEDWSISHEVNVMAHVRAARLLVPRWLERGSGRYVVTASAAGMLTLLDGPSYAVSKHGAVAFAEWLSASYRHRGIVVQVLCPQGVQTQMLAQTGGLQELLSHDSALTTEQVADAVWEHLADDRFYILPHPQVAEYYRARATDPDRWLGGMNKLQRRLEDAASADSSAGIGQGS